MVGPSSSQSKTLRTTEKKNWPLFKSTCWSMSCNSVAFTPLTKTQMDIFQIGGNLQSFRQLFLCRKSTFLICITLSCSPMYVLLRCMNKSDQTKLTSGSVIQGHSFVQYPQPASTVGLATVLSSPFDVVVPHQPCSP